MSFMFQISDPEDLQIAIHIPGKYNPDILEDGKRRLIDAYREALEARLVAAEAELQLRDKYGDTEEPSEDEKEEESVGGQD